MLRYDYFYEPSFTVARDNDVGASSSRTESAGDQGHVQSDLTELNASPLASLLCSHSDFVFCRLLLNLISSHTTFVSGNANLWSNNKMQFS
jgi:hypothetical protein